MILPAQAIRAIQPAIVEPFHERTVYKGMTFGLGPAGYDIRLAEDLSFGNIGGRTLLGSSVERFEMPDDVLGVVHDKSTWARLGLTVQNTVIEPGWRGCLTLEMTYNPLGGDRLFILAKSPIAQVVFHRLEAATEQPYSGKYQDQEEGPQPARHEALKAAKLITGAAAGEIDWRGRAIAMSEASET